MHREVSSEKDKLLYLVILFTCAAEFIGRGRVFNEYAPSLNRKLEASKWYLLGLHCLAWHLNDSKLLALSGYNFTKFQPLPQGGLCPHELGQNGRVTVLVHFLQREPNLGVRVQLYIKNMLLMKTNIITIICIYEVQLTHLLEIYGDLTITS